MTATLTAAEFEQRVNRLSERLDALRQGPRLGLTGSPLPYLGLDLTEHLPELAEILRALLNQEPDAPITKNARIEVGGRRLALACIMALMQGGDGLADFPRRFTELMGEEPDVTRFERFLPTAMREAGLALPPKGDAARYLEALLGAVGLPTGLLVATAEYFVAYWRWFHPLNDPMLPLTMAASQSGAWWESLSAEWRGRLAEAAPRLLPNAAVVGPTIEGLARIMSYLRTQTRLHPADLLTHKDEILGATGLDPAALLQKSEAAAALLGEHLGHAIHPERFRHLLMLHPRGSEVRLPSGALAMVDKAIAVPQFGLYWLDRKSYLVLPNEGATLAELAEWPKAQMVMVGRRARWRGEEEPAVLEDGGLAPRMARPAFDDKAPLGYFYEEPFLPGVRLQVGGKELAPQAGIHWRPTLVAQSDGEGQTALVVRVPSMRLCVPELAGATLQVVCQGSAEESYLLELDESGVGQAHDMRFVLTAPNAGYVDVSVRDLDGEPVSLGGRLAQVRVNLPEVMLFAEGTGRQVPPGTLAYPYGPGSYFLVANRPINTSSMQMQDIGIAQLGRTGDYEVHRLTWDVPETVFSIHVDARHQWHFSQRIDHFWQVPPEAAPPAPFAVPAMGPSGQLAASTDLFLVDDVSWLPAPMVHLERDGELLAAYTWDELNWMMNFPMENRRLSGAMLRKILHLPADLDLAGRYTIYLSAAGEVLAEHPVTILPILRFGAEPSGVGVESTSYVLHVEADQPVLQGGNTYWRGELGQAVVDREVLETSPFAPKPLVGALPVAHPRMDVPVAIVPRLEGFRILDTEGEWTQPSELPREALDGMTLVAFGTEGTPAWLKAGPDAEPWVEEPYEGFASFALDALLPNLNAHRTTIQVGFADRVAGEWTVVWAPHLVQLEQVNQFLQDMVARLEVEVDGPSDVSLKLEARSPDGRKLGTYEVEAGTGRRVVDFFLPGSRDYAHVEVVATLSGEVVGKTLRFLNVAYDPELEAINGRIAASKHDPELYRERALWFLGRGLRKPAARDFQKAIQLGLKEIESSNEYQSVMAQRVADRFHEDIKALASYFVPFARKELTLG